MNEQVLFSDIDERSRALDPGQSFIVQAPAGSGKTGLLIQRYLKLLAYVDAPEEIVAITFTRKAAAEMRERILLALEMGKNPIQAPSNSFEKLTYELALIALQRDNQLGWHITDNPARLRIQTIDSLCASLVRQMPVLSRFGAQLESVDDASDLYLEAARATIEMVESNDAVAQHIALLLAHLDNDMARIEMLLAEMLARRDHWLRHIHVKTRAELESALENIRCDALAHISSLYPDMAQNELLELVRYAAANLAADGRQSPIMACSELDVALGNREVSYWCGLSEFLLTKDSWRKRFTVENGFPPGKTKAEKENAKHWKNRALALIELLGANDGLRQALIDIRSLPPPTYTEKQWEILGAITWLLPYAVGQLKVVFQLSGRVDFTEVAQGASLALGEPDLPTDLALALDCRIRHLLIDEFQDTSISQYKLVEKLVAGWEPEDGRSLFAVGDPMQSIYRFREAEVGLFLRARSEAIGNVSLQPITLGANFRSQGGIVSWVNAAFTKIMPADEDIATGAVPYVPSVATHKTLAATAVKVHPFFNADYAAEARLIVEIVLQSQRENPLHTIAILVRNRGHLSEIVPKLKEADIRFRAVEIELLCNKPVVQDLLVLTRALIHPADRLAWYALLRAPWCGLLLKDLEKFSPQFSAASGNTKENKTKVKDCRTVWALLNDEELLGAISTDGAARLIRVREILARCINNRLRQSLRTTVEAAWSALGGPGCTSSGAKHGTQSTTDLEDAMIYFDYLEAQEVAGSIPELAQFEKGLARLYALPDLQADDKLQIMTIHKAKGLEFDTVIVPGLGRTSRSNDKRLLKWTERARARLNAEKNDNTVDLLLAPIQATGADSDPIYAWLQKHDDSKENYEDQRLLYVAATRARRHLHLLGDTKAHYNEDGVLELKKPATKTLLSKLWPIVHSTFSVSAAQQMPLKMPLNTGEFSQEEDAQGKKGAIIDQSLHRLESNWMLPAAPAPVAWHYPPDGVVTQSEIEFSWVGEVARHIGSVVHRWMQRIAEDEIKGWDAARIQSLRKVFKQALIISGMSGHDTDIACAVERVVTTLTNAVSDSRGQWILGPQQNAQNELRMSAYFNGELINIVIDRTFCSSDGKRWIIDYKTSNHEGAGVENFLNSEQARYSDQLNRYATCMQILDKRPVRLGLYFPVLRGWREWEMNDAAKKK